MKTAILVLAFLVTPIQAWAQQDMVQALTAQRAAKPTPMSRAQLSDMLNRAATQVPGWAMLRKDGGSNCPTPYPGVSISCDWLFNVTTQYGWDFVVDAENTAVIQPGNSGPLQPGQELIMPWPVTGQPQEPQQPSTGITIEQVRTVVHDEVQVVWAQNERIFANVIDNLNAIAGKQDAFADQLKAHDEKINGFLEFLKKPATLSAIVTAVTTIVTLKQTGN